MSRNSKKSRETRKTKRHLRKVWWLLVMRIRQKNDDNNNNTIHAFIYHTAARISYHRVIWCRHQLMFLNNISLLLPCSFVTFGPTNLLTVVDFCRHCQTSTTTTTPPPSPSIVVINIVTVVAAAFKEVENSFNFGFSFSHSSYRFGVSVGLLWCRLICMMIDVEMFFHLSSSGLSVTVRQGNLWRWAIVEVGQS